MTVPEDHRRTPGQSPAEEPTEPIDCGDAERMLSVLLEKASSGALTDPEAAVILSEAERIGATCPSQEVAGRLELVRFALKGPGDRETDRCRHLREQLELTSAFTPATLVRSLAAAGFSGSSTMGLSETQQFVAVIRPPLLRLKELFGGAKLGEDRTRLLVHDLGELLATLPKVPSARRMVAELQENARRNLNDLEGRGRLDGLLRSLRELERLQQDWSTLEPLDLQYAADDWIKTHPEDEKVVEVKRLILRLRDLRLTFETLDAVSREIVEYVGKGEISAALDGLNNAWRAANEKHLKTPPSLERSASAVVASLRRDLEDLNREFAADPKPTVDFLRVAVTRANQILFWSKSLPAASESEAQPVVADATALQARLSEDLRAETLNESRETFRQLSFADLPAYLKRLRESTDPVFLEWADRIAAFADDYRVLRDLDQEPGDERLDRLEKAPQEFGEGPLTSDAAREVWEYRQAREQLNKIEKDIEETAVPAPLLRDRLDPILSRFPDWRRAQDTKARIDDLDLIRQIQDLVEEGELAGASSVARGIGNSAFQSQLEDSIAGLAAAAELVRKVEAIRPSLKQTSDSGALGRLIGEAVGTVMDFSKLERTPMAASAGKRFPLKWRASDECMSGFFAGDLEEAVQRWVELAASSAKNEEELSQAERLLQGWCTNLPFAGLDETVLKRRKTVMRIEALVAQGDHAAAVRLLADAASHFSPVELQRRETAIQRARVVHEFVSDVKQSPDELVGIALVHGLDGDLNRLIVNHFKQTGDFGPLAGLATADASCMRSFPVTSQLSQWCRLFVSQQLNELSESLAASGAAETLGVFIEAAAHDRAPAAQAYFVLTKASVNAATWPEQVRETCQTSRERLKRRLVHKFDSLGNWLTDLSSRMKAEQPPLAAAGDTDDLLKAALKTAFEAARSSIKEAIRQLEEKLESRDDDLSSAHRWLKDFEEFPHLRALASSFQDMLGRLGRDLEQIDSLERSKDRLLNSLAAEWEELRGKLQRIGPGSSGQVLRLRQTTILYFKNWTEIVKLVRWLIDAYRYHRGVAPSPPEGLSDQRLSENRAKLSKEYRYDMRPGQDRFNLRALLQGADYSPFMEDLEAMQREMDEVVRYRDECRKLMVGHKAELSNRLGALESESRPDARARHLRVISDLLGKEARSNEPLSVFSRHALKPGLSKPAVEELEKLKDEKWYRLLIRAVEAVEESDPR